MNTTPSQSLPRIFRVGKIFWQTKTQDWFMVGVTELGGNNL
jgi:hypothetical protein